QKSPSYDSESQTKQLCQSALCRTFLWGQKIERSMNPLWALLLCITLTGQLGQTQDLIEDSLDNEEAADGGVELLEEGPQGPEIDVSEEKQPCSRWMGGVPGTPGHSGQPGRDGRDGRDGPRGERGERGEAGDKGDRGEKGDVGSAGPRGFPGTPGLKGARGESAFSYQSAFSVGLSEQVPTTNVPIRFNKFFYNDQHHYDMVSGKFRCVLPGVYFFTYHLTVYTKDAKVSLYRNDRAVMFTYDQYQERNVDQASGSVVLRLESGDQVWLQVYGDETVSGVYADNTNDSTFSGFLLYPDFPRDRSVTGNRHLLSRKTKQGYYA
ncbi:hypothetical protein DNTS_013972, partial [Danionella cerebrum]